MPPVRVRDARFQQWAVLATNRAKRTRARLFLVQGVRPITLAVDAGWEWEALLHPLDGVRSEWARATLARAEGPAVPVADELLAELGGKDEVPELVGVARQPPDDLDRLAGNPLRAVVYDRPASPGNLGTLLRSADAFGASGVVVTGHAADPYDPQAVRASTGSLFGVPVVRAGSPADVQAWLRDRGAQLLGTDEAGDTDPRAVDWSRPTAIVVGNEASGMSAAWRGACDATLALPMRGRASSLNAAVAASIVLYDALRASP